MVQSSGADGRRLRVLYLTWRDRDNPEAGGAETFVERTAEVLAAQGHEVTLYSAAFPGARTRDHHGKVRVLRGGGRFGVYPRGLAHVLSAGHGYDVIIDSQNGVPFWSPLVARVPVINVIHHVHKDQWGVIFGPRLARLGWVLESRVAPLVYRKSHYVTVSEATRSELVELGISADRIDVVYSGNDVPTGLDAADPVPRSEQPTLTVLGRLVPHKHTEVAIDILDRLRGRHPTLRLDIIGTGYWHDALVAHAERLGVRDRVDFHGFVEEDVKHRLLAQSWVTLMPSQKEGWGLTIVEAGLHATPAIAFAHAGGVTESIVAGETGLLARDVDEMEAQVATLLEDSALRLKFGDQARRHARSFSWDAAGRALEQILLQATSA